MNGHHMLPEQSFKFGIILAFMILCTDSLNLNLKKFKIDTTYFVYSKKVAN